MKTFLLVLAGMLLVQTAWLLVVGPFRAIDEFDHAMRADAVASGQLRGDSAGLVSVDGQFADTLRPVCLSRPGRSIACQPEVVLPNGRQFLYDTAARYDPLFYAIDGTPAMLFHGYARLYAMRGVALLLTALGTAFAATLLLVGFRKRWPALLFLAATTPMATYTAMVVAPNGLEATCAFVVWAALLVAHVGRPELRNAKLLPVAAAAAGAGLALLRTLGPLWLVCIVVAVALLSSRTNQAARPLMRRGAWRACLVIWACASAGGMTWSALAGTNSPSTPGPDVGSTAVVAGASVEAPHLFPDLLLWPFLWVLQTIGVIPYRDQALPLVVYALVLLLWLVLLAMFWRVGSTSARMSMAFVTGVSLVVPVGVTVLTYRGGWPWQGRYGWPLAVGVFLLAGVALEQATFRPPEMVRRLAGPAIGAVMALAGVISQVHVLHGELATSPLAHSDAWFRLPMPVVGLMTVTGFALMVLAIQRGSGSNEVDEPQETADAQALADPAEAVTH